uniref:Uncharacterized protein n=1 Tax=Cacopsylla melanoneura TaxID=428564 RepID=A0A8D8TPG5_9HEMI
MILGFTNHSVQIFNPGRNAHGHLTTVGGRFRAWIQGGAESFADLHHSRLQLISLEEDNKHALVHGIVRVNVFQRGLNLSLAQEHVTAACAPQHALERGHALT